MKFSIFFLAVALAPLATSAVAQADTVYQVPKKIRKLQLIAGEVRSVTTTLPKVANGIAEPTSVARIQFTLPGCVDQLGPVTVVQGPPRNGGRIHLTITAYAALNPASAYTQCIKANTADVDVALGAEVHKLELVETSFAKEFYGKTPNL